MKRSFFFCFVLILLWCTAHGLTNADFNPDYVADIFGYSVLGAPMYAVYNASTAHLPPVLVLFNIHGNENSGYYMGLKMLQFPMPDLNVHAVWVPTLNPDGVEYELRENIDGVDLNRAFGDRCQRTENETTVETEAMKVLIAKLQPIVIISYHMGAAVVVWGPDQDCNNTEVAIQAPMSPFEESLDTYWAKAYAHFWGKGDESRTIQGSAMYQVAGSLIEYAVPEFTQVALVVEMDIHKKPNDVREEIVETQHHTALMKVLDKIGKEAVTVLPECLKNETVFTDKNAQWFLIHDYQC